MARFEIIIVAWTIEIGWLGRDEVAAILTTIGLTQLDSGDFGNRILLVRWLQWPGEESALWDVIGSLATMFKPHKCLNYLASYDYNAE
jgi:hypothetical protein